MQHARDDGHGLLQSRTLAESNVRSGQRKIVLRFELRTKRHYLSPERRARYSTSNGPTPGLSGHTSAKVKCGVLSPD
jgi:hypothetical protein